MSKLTIGKLLQFPKNRLWKDNVIGFEMEVEGQGLPPGSGAWTHTHDGSLRGEAIEYVLRKPLLYPEFKVALLDLKDKFKDSRSTIHDSVRAGIHVHINVQDLTFVQLYNFITLCLVMEELLGEFCGDSRIGNLFCLRSKDAAYLIKVIRDVAQTGNLNLFHSDKIRYSFMNLKAVVEHGSIEFRALKTTTDFMQIRRWVRLLMRLKKASLQFSTPEQVIQTFSDGNSDQFMRVILGKYKKFLTFPNTNELVFNGMRNAQDVAYIADWDKLNSLGSNNPFQASDQPLFPSTVPAPVDWAEEQDAEVPMPDDGEAMFDEPPRAAPGLAGMDATTASASTRFREWTPSPPPRIDRVHIGSGISAAAPPRPRTGRRRR